jgi:hypothetical protein
MKKEKRSDKGMGERESRRERERESSEKINVRRGLK